VIYSRDEFSVRVLEELGFELPPTVAGLPGEQGGALVTCERFDALDVDLPTATSMAFPSVLSIRYGVEELAQVVA
jgi:hypothetical protein